MGTGSLTSPERGSLGREGGGCGEWAGQRLCCTSGVRAGVFQPLRSGQSWGFPDTSLVFTEERLSDGARSKSK